MYAPIGLVLDAPKYLPELAEKGRGQVALAKLIGKVAVDRMEKELGPFAAFFRAAAAWDPSSTCGPRCGPNAADEPAATPEPASTTSAPRTEPVATEASAEPGEPVAPTSGTKGRAASAARRPRPAGAGPAAATGKARTRRTREATPQRADTEQVPDEAQLPLDGYATLSASQIVPRLTTLAPAELEAVGRFERANRNRRTVLNRIDQLLGER